MTSPPFHEQRASRRHMLEYAIEFRGGQGLTRNLSSHGILFSTLEPFAPRQRFAFTLVPDNSSLIHCLAEVLRVDCQTDHYDVAALLTVVTADLRVPDLP